VLEVHVGVDGTVLHVVVRYDNGLSQEVDLKAARRGAAVVRLRMPTLPPSCTPIVGRVYVTASYGSGALTRATTFRVACTTTTIVAGLG